MVKELGIWLRGLGKDTQRAEGYALRRQTQDNYLTSLRDHNGTADAGSAWLPSNRSGNYSGIEVIAPPFVGREEHLQNTEAFLGYLIEQQLARKTQVVFLDEGGLGGLTALRLIQRFQAEVDSYRLVIAVSSVGNADVRGTRVSPSGELDGFYRDSRVIDNMHYITADAHSLPDQAITLRNGQVISLRNSVDILHEHAGAVANTYTPEDDMFDLGRLVSPDGIFLYHNEMHQFESGTEEGRMIGQRRLQQLGLRKVTTIISESGQKLPLEYTVFLGPHTKFPCFR